MLKSKLLASTVIVAAAAAVAAAPASAAKLKLSGYYEAWVGVGADGVASQVNNFDVKHDSEINFDWKQKLKNGMTVGGRMELEAGTGTTTGCPRRASCATRGSAAAASCPRARRSSSCAAGFGRVHGGAQDGGDIVDMYAAEDLSRF